MRGTGEAFRKKQCHHGDLRNKWEADRRKKEAEQHIGNNE